MENKTSNYIKYAIGEIVLVVIGILIALQINNWNETRKDKLFEQKILTQIKSTLEKDLRRTNYILNDRAKTKKSSILNLIANLNDSKIIADSLYKDFFNTSLTLSFSFDKGPYESLKSIGLDKISNDSLRNALVRFYEVSLPLTEVFVTNDKEVQSLRRQELKDHLLNLVYVKNGSIWEIKTQIDFDSLLNDQNFKKLLNMENKIADNYIDRLENVLNNIKVMIEFISHELKKL